MKNKLVVTLLVTTFLEAFCFSLSRVTSTYRALELDLSPVWLGAITAAYAVLPLLIALQVGRFIDRGNDARAGWMGAALAVAASAGIVLSSSLVTLIVCTVLMGAAQMLVALSMQTIAARISPPGKIDRVIGHYMLFGVAGQSVAPIVIGWIGGSASIPPTQILFEIALAASVLTLVGTLMQRNPRDRARSSKAPEPPLPLRDIVLMPGMPVVFLVSISVVTAQDLLGVYLPFIGAERGIPVSDIGIVLAVRSIASMAIRAVYIRLVEKLGRPLLLKLSTAIAAIAYFGLALPLPVWALCIIVALLGGSLGITMTLSISRAVEIPGPRARGTANSIRMMGNRAALVIFPSIAGVTATFIGVASIFILTGIALVGVWSVVQFAAKRPKEP